MVSARLRSVGFRRGIRLAGTIFAGSSIHLRSQSSSRYSIGLMGRVELGADRSALAVHRVAAIAVNTECRVARNDLGSGVLGRRGTGKAAAASHEVHAHQLVRPAVVALLAELCLLEVVPDEVERREIDPLLAAGFELVDGEALLAGAVERQPRLVVQHALHRKSGLVAVPAREDKQQLRLSAPVIAVEGIEHGGERDCEELDLSFLVGLKDPKHARPNDARQLRDAEAANRRSVKRKRERLSGGRIRNALRARASGIRRSNREGQRAERRAQGRAVWTTPPPCTQARTPCA